jgi:ethanolamine utilization protein EutQ (cupin superfamily)
MTGNSGLPGGSTNKPVIDEGTLIRHRSPSPEPIGLASKNNLYATPENGSRELTPGEIQMAKKIFKDSINYAKVRIHNEGYFPFGLQDANTAVTPNGEMYFLPDDFEEDFSISRDAKKLWFIHEITHVWQYQLGYWVRFRGSFRPGLD